MTRASYRRYHWSKWVAACLVIVACAFGARSLAMPQSATVTKPLASEPDPNVIFENREPVGWVFGRVVGFEGADKPMLPRQTFPTPNPGMFHASGSR